VDVEVAIGLLGAGEQADDVVHLPVQGGVGVCAEAEAGAFEPLGDIRFPEHMRDGLDPGVPGHSQSVDAAGPLKHLVDVRDGDPAIGFDAEPPEPALEPDRARRERLEAPPCPALGRGRLAHRPITPCCRLRCSLSLALLQLHVEILLELLASLAGLLSAEVLVLVELEGI